MTAEVAEGVEESDVFARALGALLREDPYGLRPGAVVERRSDGDWLRLPMAEIPVRPDGFQCEIRVRPTPGLGAVLDRLRAAVPEPDLPGFDAFRAECDQAVATARLQRRERPRVTARLAEELGPAGEWTGMRGALAFEALAAFRDHPVYPTGRVRRGLSESQLLSYAPEFRESFRLRWLVLPGDAVTLGRHARLPDWWPTPAFLGLTGAGEGSLPLPVHPLTADDVLTGAADAAGPAGRARFAEKSWLEVVPTLSMRTVAAVDDPGLHLKLPLPTATLGLLNRRTIKPGVLAQGECGQRLLAEIAAREPRFAGTVLLTDEGTHLGAGHELLAALVRRYPDGLEDAHVLPVAALLATDPRGRLVVDVLAERYYGGSTAALLDAYLRLLLDWHTTLFSYGVALESHQQNTSIVLDEQGGRPRLRLLFKDNDGPRVHRARLAERLGEAAADDALLGFTDPRAFAADDGPLADLFTTVTVHLCAAALAFELAELGRGSLDDHLALLRARLAAATGRLPPGPAAVLRARVLEAPRLPVKAMVTAGTLFTKARSGAADINKHYVDGPNYLLRRGPGAEG
ncbi:IucA/IucC family protein [Streptomyces luteireticuli]|uniref:IucA/IucC family protein n=1 Tax=Streptomyces luteireticuli TaxID=173858 RepID=UPI0035580561